MTEVPAEKPVFRPRWALIGLIAAGVVLLIIIIVVALKVVAGTPLVPLGATDSDELVVGSCLAEDEADLEEYTVVDCASEHPQQVVAEIDLGKSENVYSQFAPMSAYAQEICDRLIEYRLYLREGPSYDDYAFTVLAMPSEEQFAGGRTTALCAITDPSGGELSESFYRPMP